MPQIVVTIDGKTYRMACAEGEEAHLETLAADVDGKIAELRESFGQIGDLRLTVMAAIMATDQLFEARRRIGELEGRVEADAVDRAANDEDGATARQAFIRSLDETAETIERITAKLAGEGR
ncbi:cell division protein ZapA [Jiella sp. MQZ9-1]|uniref:Cell division protein ZapA n=1 Tax=Jiella flava TaxID=2816857 RepID=A0A939FWC9_9HYPH|nr:cell division protein ZapA [Jiella flava]MBO0662064.1 cell division protein ZapA [Jiella flava]MCD2470608.1 cell division protein ZapA [Jiella flava]